MNVEPWHGGITGLNQKADEISDLWNPVNYIDLAEISGKLREGVADILLGLQPTRDLFY